MEIIIGLIVLVAAGFFIFRPKKVETVVEEAAPYKVETPAPVVIETAKVEEAPAKPARAKKTTAKAKAPAKTVAKKPAAKKTVAKKTAKKTK